jgi:hypothetical protein
MRRERPIDQLDAERFEARLSTGHDVGKLTFTVTEAACLGNAITILSDLSLYRGQGR